MNVVLSDFAINILPFHRITTIKFVSHIFFLCSAIFFPSRQLQLFNFFTPDLSKQFVDLMVFFSMIPVYFCFFLSLFGLRIFFPQLFIHIYGKFRIHIIRCVRNRQKHGIKIEKLCVVGFA